MIGKKANAEFEANQQYSIEDIHALFFCQDIIRPGKIPIKQRPTIGHIKSYRLVTSSGLPRSVTAGSQAIAEVMVHQSQGHRIKIKQSECLSLIIKDKIVDLGITMNWLKSQNASLFCLFQKSLPVACIVR